MPVPLEAATAIVLAAGKSSRFGAPNKLLADFEGRPLVRHAVATVAGLGFLETLVVTGHEGDLVESSLAGLAVRCVANPDFEAGIGSSLSFGVRSASRETRAFFITLGDMPFVRRVSVRKMFALLRSSDTIVVSRSIEMSGIPVVFGSDYRDELSALTGDKGASQVWRAHEDRVAYLDVDPLEQRDVDRRDDLV